METNVLELTIKKLEKQFPDKTMLTVQDVAEAYGFKNVQTIYNSLRMKKGSGTTFPKPIRRAGRLYWNIVKIAEDMAC